MRRPDLVTRRIDGEIVILDRQAGYVHQLNATATEIWSCCDGAHAAPQIAARLAALFDHPAEAVLDDVRAALTEFEKLGLLIEAGSQFNAESGREGGHEQH